MLLLIGSYRMLLSLPERDHRNPGLSWAYVTLSVVVKMISLFMTNSLDILWTFFSYASCCPKLGGNPA